MRGKPGKPTGHRSRPNPSNRDKDNSDDLVGKSKPLPLFVQVLNILSIATSIILDTMWQEFEDIASSIVQVDERASVTTGRFCDLFIGTHESYGKVALKRPRIDQQSYSRRDIRVSVPPYSCSAVLAAHRLLIGNQKSAFCERSKLGRT